MAAIFETLNEPVAARIAAGLSKLSTAIKSQAWQAGESHGLTPTQAQILTLIDTAGGSPPRPSAIAARLQVSRPTASNAIAALVRKGLVARAAVGDDRRGAALRLTRKGRTAAATVAGWPAFLVRAVEELPETQQVALLRGIVGTIRALQLRGEIAVARLCVTCRYFRPNVHSDPAAPHHCAYVDAPFGDRHLRLDCPEQEQAPDAEQSALWSRFIESTPIPQQKESLR